MGVEVGWVGSVREGETTRTRARAHTHTHTHTHRHTHTSNTKNQSTDTRLISKHASQPQLSSQLGRKAKKGDGAGGEGGGVGRGKVITKYD